MSSLLLIVLLTGLTAVQGTDDFSGCLAKVADFPCHASRCTQGFRHTIANTVPLGRGFDLALSDDVHFTNKPHVYEQSYCRGSSSAIRLWNHQLACEQTSVSLGSGLESDVQRSYSSHETLSSDLAQSARIQAAAGSLGAFGGAVGGSVSDLREHGGSLAIRRRTLMVGRINLDGLECLNFTENYRRCFNQLHATDPTHDSYETIFTDFGTHVVVEVEVGGQQTVLAKVNECSRREFTKSSNSLDLSLGKILSFGIGETTTLNATERKLNAETSIYARGGDVSLYQAFQWDAYKRSVPGREGIIRFSRLKPLYELVSVLATQNDPRDLTTLAATFKNATMAYIQSRVIPSPSAQNCSTTL